MRAWRLVFVVCAIPLIVLRPSAAPHQPTIAQYLKPGLPIELVSARKADRIAWIAYEEGKRNVFTAAAPAFKPVRVTAFLKDDGTDMTALRISDDGMVVTFVRGSDPNNAGWVANPHSDPSGAERAIWAARVGVPGSAFRLAVGNNPQMSPDGRFVLYLHDGQIYRARVGATPGATPIDKGDKPFINAWGANSGPKWSPDSSKIAFVSNRADHSFIGVYDMKTRALTYLAPSVDRDTSPTWSSDSKRIAFVRRPGLPFGQQATPGAGSGMPANVGGRNGGGGGARGAAPAAQPAAAPVGRGAAPTAPAQTQPAQTQPATAAVPGAPSTPPAAASAEPPATAPNAAPAQTAPGGRGGRGRNGGNAGNGGAAGEQAQGGGQGGANAPPLANQPGLYQAAFQGGYTLAIMMADVATGEATEAWHPAAGDAQFSNINAIQWAGDVAVFSIQPPGGRGGGGLRGGGAAPAAPGAPVSDDESPRYYALNLLTPNARPVMLNTTTGIVEDQTAWTLSQDGKTFFYCTNTNDIDRRHIWAVPTSGGTPAQITTGDGIENVPVTLASGKHVAVLSADAKRPMSVGIWPATPASPASSQHVIYPTLAADFPMDEEVVPTNVVLKADDGQEFHNQLFLPKNMRPGEKHPALIFVHGGPRRQMLLGWHYLSFYHVFYGVNQWLASKGYIVLSVNYRLGVGYGRAFGQPADGGARGNGEYRDVLAAGKWLAARQDVDPARVGIWGLSYGGLLTSEALARNSDVFKAGIDLAGVHLEGTSLDPNDVSYQSSTIAAIDQWKSPVLLIQGDDDRNVNFAQMVGLVQLLRARNIYHELIVFPDDVHETLLHSRWLYSFSRFETFLNKFLPPNADPASKPGR